ncbi:MAG: PTS sugar transporter subunit IIA [Anaerostipes sp.]|jgi:PTS system galactitol-specific IIA component
MEVEKLFQEKHIMMNLEKETREEVITALFDKLYASNSVKESFIENVLKREKVYPTGLKIKNFEIAIPHTEGVHVNESTIAIATLKTPVSFQCMEDPEEEVQAKIVMMMALKDGHNHLQMISRIVKMFQKQEVLSGLEHAETEHEIINLIQQYL